MLRLHDTASRRALELRPTSPGVVGLYVCGPTVYGPPHIGHGYTTLVYDVLRRYLEWAGYKVEHVSNVTDVDDKIINQAAAEGRGWREVAAGCEAQWWAAMDALGALRPVEIPHATDYVEEMIDLVASLLERGVAYETSDGVYLGVKAVTDYGLLKHQSLDSLQPGARVEVIDDKRSPLDFALWKAAKPGEPVWVAPFGAGRPGWHTECVVMSHALLGENFDLHGGGQDLIFPHHENERAQAEVLGRDLCKAWVHSGLVTVGGTKMSKSLGNFTTLEDLLTTVDPRAYRLLVLRSHYRSPLEVTAATLEDSARALARLDALARRVGEAPKLPVLAPEVRESEALRSEFVERMDDDLDTPSAVAALFESIRRANALLDEGDVAGSSLGAMVLELFAAVGLSADRGDTFESDAGVQELARRRDAARAERDFALADALRGEIELLGWRVEDGPSGTVVRR